YFGGTKKMILNLLFKLKKVISRKKYYTLSYHGLKLKFTWNPRSGFCQICGNPAHTNIHHCCYNFTKTEVQRNPSLAFLFTFESCFSCHELANSIRKLLHKDKLLTLQTKDSKIRRIYDYTSSALVSQAVFNMDKEANLKRDYFGGYKRD
ncbi:MAG: hypothetical protein QM398_10890, partial [Thermoproteota archaeon]|nr:hypothetical protein [Thermoproteota archaeon]